MVHSADLGAGNEENLGQGSAEAWRSGVVRLGRFPLFGATEYVS